MNQAAEKKFVLVIDHSISVKEVVKATLESTNRFEVNWFGDGKKGMQYLDENKYIDWVFCDVEVKECFEILGKHCGPGVEGGPLFFATTKVGLRDHLNLARKAGAKGWLVKPFQSYQLLKVAEKVEALGWI